jgi:glycosyltransferase involved in cell wall biosynthesis
MKILQVIATLSAGGAEGFITNLGVSLAELGHEVRLFLLAGVRGERGLVLQQRLERAGIKVNGSDGRKPASISNLMALAGLIRAWNPDIVHANLLASEVACALARVLSLKFRVGYVHRLANTRVSAFRSQWAQKILWRSFVLHIACSPAVAMTYYELVGEPVRRKLLTIFNGGQLLHYVPTADEKASARHALCVPDTAFVVAHIGSIFGGGRGSNATLEMGQKGHDVLLRSFDDAFGGDQNCILLCAGDGPLRLEAKRLAQHLGIGNQVRFLGEIPEPWAVLRAADVFCFPSRYEGIPNVLPEAASCGLPVVASDIPEIRALYPGEGWLLVPKNDIFRFARAIETVRNQRVYFSQEAIRAAPEFRRQFSMKACAEKYIDAYKLVFDREVKMRKSLFVNAAK